MKKLAMIPARYAATRFPFKLMQQLGDKTVIRHTYDNTVATGLFDEVWVVTDDDIILEEITRHGGQAIKSSKSHESGSDRIGEAIETLEGDVIVNVQGDEPFISYRQLANLLEVFKDENVQVASLMKEITETATLENPNIVKLLTDAKNNALYFSRSVIPYVRDAGAGAIHYEHVGVYAYRRDALINFTRLPAAPAEKAEMLEQLRYLYNGIKIKMVETTEAAIKIDVPGDLAIAEKYLPLYNAKKNQHGKFI
ncbi:MAG: 3-deoxy-manno-octulosonate cytidylyltransferase [Ferruginibacter sp.]